MATFVCRVQFLDDTDPFNSTNFPEPTRPPLYTFREDIPLINQIAGVHRLLKAPQKPDDCALQLSHNGSYLDLESTLAEQRDELEGFQEEGGRGKKHSIILRTQLSVRVHACIGRLPQQGLSLPCIPPPLQALLNLPPTLTTDHNVIRFIVHGHSRLTSSINLSITIANKKGLRADLCNPTIAFVLLFPGMKPYCCSLIITSPLNLASTTLSHNFMLLLINFIPL
eukprot:superscaffoldBa00000597_g5935